MLVDGFPKGEPTSSFRSKHKALAKVEKREIAAFMRDQRADARTQARGGDDHAPSLVELLEPTIRTRSDAREGAPDLLQRFGEAKARGAAGPPDLLAAFDRAASGRREKRRKDESGAGYDGPRSPGDGAPWPERGRER